MTSKQRTLLIGGIAVLIVGAAFIIGPLLEKNFGGEDHSSINHSDQQTTSNSDDSLVQTNSAEYKMYNAMTGDDFDRAFLADMIAHHQGAVEMANLALERSNHQEIIELSQNIITAQDQEIAEMGSWQQEWGYNGTESHDHDSMDMSSDMKTMLQELQNKTGDQFDQAWLEQMIAHHQGAINMAAPGEKNAKHQELKDLTKNVVVAQSKEIRQMQNWQREWGYQ